MQAIESENAALVEQHKSKCSSRACVHCSCALPRLRQDVAGVLDHKDDAVTVALVPAAQPCRRGLAGRSAIPPWAWTGLRLIACSLTCCPRSGRERRPHREFPTQSTRCMDAVVGLLGDLVLADDAGSEQPDDAGSAHLSRGQQWSRPRRPAEDGRARWPPSQVAGPRAQAEPSAW
jgi:hypothetical protein